MANEDKVPKPDFSIKVESFGNGGRADKLIIVLIGIGNKLLFVNGKNLYLEIPTGSRFCNQCGKALTILLSSFSIP